MTAKHSPVEWSLAFGTPVVLEVKSPRQQYLPTDVTVAAIDVTGIDVVLLTLIAEPIATPPVSQVPDEMGPHRWNAMLPDQGEMPLTERFAESVTLALPVPIEMPAAPTLGVVTRLELPAFAVSVPVVSGQPVAGTLFVFGELPL